ncbi:hypothetical protein DV735_g2685, partial [Chaetothyriales sp. CBS 134920]
MAPPANPKLASRLPAPPVEEADVAEAVEVAEEEPEVLAVLSAEESAEDVEDEAADSEVAVPEEAAVVEEPEELDPEPDDWLADPKTPPTTTFGAVDESVPLAADL